jgi:hypothetical protein
MGELRSCIDSRPGDVARTSASCLVRSLEHRARRLQPEPQHNTDARCSTIERSIAGQSMHSQPDGPNILEEFPEARGQGRPVRGGLAGALVTWDFSRGVSRYSRAHVTPRAIEHPVARLGIRELYQRATLFHEGQDSRQINTRYRQAHPGPCWNSNGVLGARCNSHKNGLAFF